MKFINFHSLLTDSILLFGLLTSHVFGSEIWKPVCPEYVACSRPEDATQRLSFPFLDKEGVFWLRYGSGFTYFPYETSTFFHRYTFKLSSEGIQSIDPASPILSQRNTIQEKDTLFHFAGIYVGSYNLAGKHLSSTNLSGQDFDLSDPASVAGLSRWHFTGPPVMLNGTIYSDLTGGRQYIIHHQADGSWKRISTELPDRAWFRYLSANPSQTGLWVLSEFDTGTGFDRVKTIVLFESLDQGASWHRVNHSAFGQYQLGGNGQWPEYEQSLVLDPDQPRTAYALFAVRSGTIDIKGLYVSHDNGQTWKPTGLQLGANSLVIVPGFDGKRLIAGTNQGVQVSDDGGISWRAMNAGLFAIPHSVQYTPGLLLASSEAGYFTCSDMNCSGDAFKGKVPEFPPNQEPIPPRTISAIEFYNRTFDHYFLTASAEESVGIDEGKAGLGWERTGHSFKVWPKLGAPTGAHVCRFYGSVNPGPNSHFFSISPAECSQLLELQNSIPEGKPRWHLEDYAFMAVPPQADRTCPESYQPVFRAYNNGFKLGKDSNHRFVTDRSLLEPLFEKGWQDEGVGFCAPE